MRNGAAEDLRAHLRANRCAEVDMARRLSYHMVMDEKRLSEKVRGNLGGGVLAKWSWVR